MKTETSDLEQLRDIVKGKTGTMKVEVFGESCDYEVVPPLSIDPIEKTGLNEEGQEEYKAAMEYYHGGVEVEMTVSQIRQYIAALDAWNAAQKMIENILRKNGSND